MVNGQLRTRLGYIIESAKTEGLLNDYFGMQ